MAKHSCDVPNTSKKTWRCPVCKRSWRFDKNAGQGADLWHGRDNTRHANGSKTSTTFWGWLTS